MINRNYMPRLADSKLRDELETMGAVLIEGCKWCGKTTTAEQTANSVLDVSLPSNRLEAEIASDSNLDSLLEGATPRLLDEWQVAPSLWDGVRRKVDDRSASGQFILTGSAAPADMQAVIHSGVGRISRIKMRPMSLYESRESSGEISLASAFNGETSISSANELSFEDVAFCCCRGGWPVAVKAQRPEVALRYAYNYVDAVINNEIARAYNIDRDPDRVRRLFRSYARLQGSQATSETIINDIYNNEAAELSRDSISAYTSSLRRIFTIEDMPAWSGNLRSKTAIRTRTTRYFVDPSIATAALDVDPAGLVRDLNLFGFIFETLCVRDLRIYADSMDAVVRHYRDKRGLECDAVIVKRNGDFGLVEIKLGGESLINEAIRNLNTLNDDLVKKPAFRMVLTANSPYAYQRKDGIYIVPIGCLGP